MERVAVRPKRLVSENRKLARKLWGNRLDGARLSSLREITKCFHFFCRYGGLTVT